MIQRKITKQINKWYENSRNALLVMGARQVGKTYIIREFIREYNSIEINFIKDQKLIPLLERTSNIDEFISILELFYNRKIKSNTIIFFDEIQEYQPIITQVKFLVDSTSYRFIISGSLLGVELNNIKSFPVGYLTIKQMYPIDFEEFIDSFNVSKLIKDTLYSCYRNNILVDENLHEKMLSLFHNYLIIGGMPQVVAKFIENQNIIDAKQIQSEIVELYKYDFTKYEKEKKLHIIEIYNNISNELNKQNKRYKLSSLGKTVIFDRYEKNFLWLKDAGVVNVVYNVDKPKSPLIISKNKNLFKLFVTIHSRLSNE